MKLHRGNLRMLLVILTVLFMRYDAKYFNIGVGIFCIGLIIHFISKGYLYRNLELAVNGPYSFVRHPFYFANLLMDTGIIFMSGYPIFFFIYLALYFIAYHKVILGEEAELIRRYGDVYKDYTRRVPRYLPGVKPYVDNWQSGFKMENILREREISRIVRLLSYPISFLVAHEIIKYRFNQPKMPFVLSGVYVIVFLLWISYIVHNMVERKRAFQTIQPRVVYLSSGLFFAVFAAVLVILNYCLVK